MVFVEDLVTLQEANPVDKSPSQISNASTIRYQLLIVAGRDCRFRPAGKGILKFNNGFIGELSQD